jgi:hypothetical protein
MLQSSNSFEEDLERVQKFHVEHPDGWFQWEPSKWEMLFG